MALRPAASLQARAVAWLAQREYSRSELRRKLLRAARPAADAPAATDPAATAAQVDALLDRLQAQDLLSDERFAESRLRLRSATRGARQVEAELARHGVTVTADALKQLRDTELDRALALWRRRYGRAAGTPAEQARQMRFLAGRGFDAEVVRRVLRIARGEGSG